MERIEQDNRLLAELDRPRSSTFTFGGNSYRGMAEKVLSSSLNNDRSASAPSESGYSSTNTQPVGLYTLGPAGTGIPDMLMTHQPVLIPQVHQIPGAPIQQVTLPFVAPQGIPVGPPANLSALSIHPGIPAHHQVPHTQPFNTTQLQLPSLPMGLVPQIITTHTDEARANLLNANVPGLITPVNNLTPSITLTDHLDNRQPDLLEIPGKGCCFVYIARYSYDPFQQSPNELPEAELPLHAGDYVLVWGYMDEDGFLDGELLDGRRGLVPSNYVERLRGEDLTEFHETVVMGFIRNGDDAASTSIPAHLQDDEAHRAFLEEKHRMLRCQPSEYSYLDIEDPWEEEEAMDKPGTQVEIAAPRQLTLERQLNKSIVIGWNPPDCPPGAVQAYHVFVDGHLKCVVGAGERTRALVEGVDSLHPHRISVRAVTPHGRASRDAACTMVIGKNAPLAPSCVRASNVTSTSAAICWLPSNSNFQHVVCVNNVEVRTVKPGVYRHIITGLAPSTTYWVTVRSKNIKAPHFDEQSKQQIERLSTHIEFRTKSKGLPDPPVDVQVESGPQDGTLLVTWVPCNSMTSHGAPVTGYAVFADGRKVTEIDSPTGDHALIELGRLMSSPRQVTVRTKAKEFQSSDSLPAQVPSQFLKGKRKDHQQDGNKEFSHRQISLEHEDSFSDREPHGHHGRVARGRVPTIEITRENAMMDDMMDRGRGGHHQRMRGHPNQRPVDRGRPPPGGPQDMRDKERGRERDRLGRERMDYRGGGREDAGRGGYDRMGRERDRDRDAAGGRLRGDKERSRLFLALFDYDPQTMSPNPDACDEELPFREGQFIRVYGDKDADGFYWGELNGRRGFVPCNMVSEVQVDDERVAHELVKEGGEMGRDRWGDIYANMPVRRMVAMYDYDPQELSPNVDAEVELSFRTGEVIHVFGDMDDDGFYMGELGGVRGLVPSNFLTEAPPDYERRSHPGGPYPPRDKDRDTRVRGQGPGARGPPPPPRDRRKDACTYPVVDPNELQEDPRRNGGKRRWLDDGEEEGDYEEEDELAWGGHPEDATGRRHRREHRSRRDQDWGGPGGHGRGRGRGRGRGGVGPPDGGGMGRGRGTSPGSVIAGDPTGGGVGQPHQMTDTQSGLIGGDATTVVGRGRAPARVQKGLPAVIPEPLTEPAPPITSVASAMPSQRPAFLENVPGLGGAAPNLMQKFTEIAGEGQNSVNNVLSKGKELIFKKFGLG